MVTACIWTSKAGGKTCEEVDERKREAAVLLYGVVFTTSVVNTLNRVLFGPFAFGLKHEFHHRDTKNQTSSLATQWLRLDSQQSGRKDLICMASKCVLSWHRESLYEVQLSKLWALREFVGCTASWGAEVFIYEWPSGCLIHQLKYTMANVRLRAQRVSDSENKC